MNTEAQHLEQTIATLAEAMTEQWVRWSMVVGYWSGEYRSRHPRAPAPSWSKALGLLRMLEKAHIVTVDRCGHEAARWRVRLLNRSKT